MGKSLKLCPFDLWHTPNRKNRKVKPILKFVALKSLEHFVKTTIVSVISFLRVNYFLNNLTSGFNQINFSFVWAHNNSFFRALRIACAYPCVGYNALNFFTEGWRNVGFKRELAYTKRSSYERSIKCSWVWCLRNPSIFSTPLGVLTETKLIFSF